MKVETKFIEWYKDPREGFTGKYQNRIDFWAGLVMLSAFVTKILQEYNII